MSHNLGADTSLDPHTPVKGLNGDYYQWGKNAPDGTVDNPITFDLNWGNQGGSTANGNWLPNSKGPNDPCPEGCRVPSQAEWVAVINSNGISRTGPANWSSSATQFGNTINFGQGKQLTLPVAGRRAIGGGQLQRRGLSGIYWSSTESGNDDAIYLGFDRQSLFTSNAEGTRLYGYSVRCITE
jgi:uncharacterized protein (TIGR02145 family)